MITQDNKTKNQERKTMSFAPLTIVIPKQSGLRDAFNDDVLTKGGFTFQSITKETGMLVDTTGDIENIPVEILDKKDCLGALAMGQATLGITGDDVFNEFRLASNKTPPISVALKTNAALCNFCLAGKPEDNVSQTGISTTRGRTIVTSYPNILEAILRDSGIVSNTKTWDGYKKNTAGIPEQKIATIFPVQGKTERQADKIGALVFDLVETGGSLKRNGFDLNGRLTLMESTLFIAQSTAQAPMSASDERTKELFLKRMEAAIQKPENIAPFVTPQQSAATATALVATA